MQNNFVAAIEAAPANNQENNSNTNIMNNYTIDFTSALGEAAVAQTATVDLQVVSDIYNAFMAIPQEVVVRFRYDNGFLKMVVQMNHRDKFFHKYETPADVKLVESMIAAMAAGQIGALKAYTNEEHQLVASDTDPRVDIFKQFTFKVQNIFYRNVQKIFLSCRINDHNLFFNRHRLVLRLF